MPYRVRTPWIVTGVVGIVLFASLRLVPNHDARRPRLFVHDVVNAANHVGGKVAPGEIVLLYPSNAGPATFGEYSQSSSGRVATSIGETRVLFDGTAAAVYYAFTGQIAAIVPYEVASATKTRVSLEYKGNRSQEIILPVVESVPAIFTSDSSGRGQASMLNEIGCCNSAQNPAARGSVVSIYATGEGETVPHGIDGGVTPFTRLADLPVPKQKLMVTLGGEPAQILFASEAPLAVAGLLQVNFRVPLNAPVGDAVPLVLTVGARSSADGVTMAIKSASQRVLVMEDQPAICSRIKDILQGSDYEVVVRTDSSKTEAIATDAMPDLVIYDIAMPVDAGRTLQALRAGRKKLRIIAITTKLDPTALRYADLLGAQAVLTESLLEEALLKRVHQILSEHPLPYAVDGHELPPIPNSSIPR